MITIEEIVLVTRLLITYKLMNMVVLLLILHSITTSISSLFNFKARLVINIRYETSSSNTMGIAVFRTMCVINYTYHIRLVSYK